MNFDLKINRGHDAPPYDARRPLDKRFSNHRCTTIAMCNLENPPTYKIL